MSPADRGGFHIFLIRHAESAANAGGRTDDHATIPITEFGRRQARRVADAIASKPGLVVVSPFLRTVQTAAPLLERYPGVPVESWAVEEFNYLDAVACAGTTYGERQVLRDAYWTRCDPAWVDGSGCESFENFIARIRRFERALGERPPSETIVVYTHGLVMQSLFWLQRYPSDGPTRESMQAYDCIRQTVAVPNCAILPAALGDNGRLRISSELTTAHLTPDGL